METTFMNMENSKTNEPHKFVPNSGLHLGRIASREQWAPNMGSTQIRHLKISSKIMK